MRFIKLLDADLEALKDGHRNGKNFMFRNSCQCLILSHQGNTIPQLMKFFKVHRVTIYAWIDLWESGGIEALLKSRDKVAVQNFHLPIQNTLNEREP